MGESPDAVTVVEIFDAIKDPRFARTRLHPLSSILMLCLCAVICGADTVMAIERYGHNKIDFLKQWISFPHGIRSHDTIARVLVKLNPMGLESCFAQWMSCVAKLSDHEVVAIDGKTLRRSWDRTSRGRVCPHGERLGELQSHGPHIVLGASFERIQSPTRLQRFPIFFGFFS